MINKFTFISLVLIILLSSFSLGYISNETRASAENLIQNRVNCANLTESQLEGLGDYYMEQMHPGEAHELMDNYLGGEGSESLRQVHIALGKAFYCGDRSAMSPAMMNSMMGRGMMGPYSNYYNYNQGYGIMIVLLFFLVILILLLVAVIVYLIVKNSNQKNKR